MKEVNNNEIEPTKYRDWDILDELPQGWVIDKTAGAPLVRTVFITNGHSLLSGLQKRALLRVEVAPTLYKEHNINIVTPFINSKNTEKESESYVFPAKPINDLARLKFKEKMLIEIKFDLAVCELEGWDKKEYINELKELLNEFNL